MNKSTIRGNERRCLSAPWSSERKAGELRALGRAERKMETPQRAADNYMAVEWSGCFVIFGFYNLSKFECKRPCNLIN